MTSSSRFFASAVRHPRPRLGYFGALLLALGCGETQGPSLRGPPFFRVAVDGQPVVVSAAQAGCGDSGLIISVASLAPAIPDADVLELRVHNVAHATTFALTDVPSGRFAHTYFLGPAGLSYATTTGSPGRLIVTGLDFVDSTIAGRFAFRLVSQLNPSNGFDVSGAFRLPLGQVYTVQNPEGTPCQAPPN